MSSKRTANTAAHRAKVLADYQALIEEEDRTTEPLRRITDEKFAQSHGISRSTLYRWLAGRRKEQATAFASLEDVSFSIQTLRADRCASEWDLLAAAANFSAWLVYPKSYLNRYARTLSLIAAQIDTNTEFQTIDSFPTEAQKALQRFISLHLLKGLSGVEPIWGGFDYYEIYESGYDERGILKAVGRKILSSKSPRDISLNKLRRLLDTWKLLDTLSMGPNAFTVMWKTYASTIPYLCAEHDTGIDWHFTFSERSNKSLSALIEDQARIREFFRTADHHIAHFQAVLDPRAWFNIEMPERT